MESTPEYFTQAPGQKMLKLLPKAGQRYGLSAWHTHMPMIVTALCRLQPKRILELGIGDYSTALIGAYVRGSDAQALSLENDFHEGWYEGLTWMSTPQHEIRKIEEWDYTQWPGPWDFVFIDQGPELERIPALKYYLETGAKVVGIHDCNYPGRYQELLDQFKYVVHDQTHQFFTTLASNEVDITKWFRP